MRVRYLLAALLFLVAGQAEGQPGQGPPAQGQPAQGQPAQGQPAQGQPAQGQPAQGQPAQGQPAQGQPAPAHPKSASSPQDKPWCAPELEALEGDVCHHASPAAQDGRRTLVVFLHGLVQRGAGWQHAQHRGIVRGAKRLGFSVIMPRGRTGGSPRWGDDMVAWPTGAAAQRDHEDQLLATWRQAQRDLEARQEAPFDEVFVVGFSNGAYYASSLALRGKLEVDGYAVFAGGSARTIAAPKRQTPLFVGICAKDAGTARDARGLRKQLRRAQWPHRAESRRVGHAMADAHLDHAIAYLRAATSRAGS